MAKLQGTWVLAVAKAVLDVALSVAASVILSLLLISGDVEENPGPVGDLDYESIDDSQILNEDDLTDIMEEVADIKSMYFDLGQCLRLRNDDLEAILIKYPNESDRDAKRALNNVLLLWLKKEYNVERFGPPTWRMLVEAVNKRSGGNNYELAKQIALNHPAESDADVLSINNIKEVLDEMWDYRARWKFIGIHLHIDTGTLDAIEKDCKTVDDCLLRMIKSWLRNSPRPTRESIRVALRSKHVSNAAADDRKSESDDKLEEFTAYLKSLYKAKTHASFSGDDHWPPSVTDKVFCLARIMPEEVKRRNIDDHFIRETITGKIDDILQRKVPITLEQIFEKPEQKKVLIEGAPGCGKSTLSLHICHEWVAGQLLKEYSQVILVKLREEVVQNAKSIADLLPKRDGTMGQNAEKEITTRDGEGVLFLFDGWDELPERAPGRSIIRDILDCEQLHKSSVVITSRPISSMNLHKLVNTRIEILGFTKAELRKYFTGCLGDDLGKVKELQQRIKENPIVEGSCYFPLNASILVHLFKCDGVLPHTRFGIFSALTCNCIFRHLKKQRDVPGIKSLDKLPTAIQSQFEHICEIAYKGVIEDHITFDLERSFNTLGLLQGVESFASGMPSHSYNFLHLSLQELLAAIHMATKLDLSEQVAQFKELFGRARFNAVFQFYAAKTKLKTQGMDEIVIQVVRKCMEERKATVLTPHSGTNSDLDSGGSSLGHKSQPLLLSLLHCLFEAQDVTLCQLVAKELKGELRGLQNISLSPADCLSVGYFLTHCRQFIVYLSSCSMGADGCKALFRKDKKYDLEYLDLSYNSISDEGVKVLSDAIKTMANLKKLNLDNNSFSDEGAKALSDAFKTMANLQYLNLDNNSFSDEGAKALSDAIKTMANLQELSLWGNDAIGNKGRIALEEAAKEKGIGLVWDQFSPQDTDNYSTSDVLTESDTRVLALVLSEYLPNLEESGLNLKQDIRITKEEVVMHLWNIDQHELAAIFSEDNGLQLLQDHFHSNIYKKALQDTEHIVNLQVFRMVLCGVPRSGKTTFWKRIAKEDFKPSPESASTGAAESQIISAVEKKKQKSGQKSRAAEKIVDMMLFDFHLYSSDSDLDSEALTIYKLILERHRPKSQPETHSAISQDEQYELQTETYKTQDELQASINEIQASETKENLKSNNSLKPVTDSETTLLPSPSGDIPKDVSEMNSANSPALEHKTASKKETSDAIIAEISKQFKKLDQLHMSKDLPDLPDIKKMCHLQDTGGQRAFLELLPTISTGKALYLLFFNYVHFEKSISETMQAEGSPEELSTGIEYKQIDVIMQSLICVSTASEVIQSTVEGQSTNNIALLVGTHVDKVTSEDIIRVDNIIYENVKPFLKKRRLMHAQSGGKECLVLKVAINENELCSNEPQDYINVIMNIVDNKLKSNESEELPASWYMFCIMLRRLQNAGYSILRYSHCQCIANKLYIPESELKSVLFRLKNVFGIILYFPEIKALEDIVVCDPAFVYKRISELIFKSFRGCCDVSSLNKLQKHGIFEYKELEKQCEIKQDLELSKLIILLKHLGIIAPIKRTQIAKSKYKDDEDIHPDQEYVIPCVLKEAKQHELNVQLNNTQACSIVPLRIYFECGFAPMGGFCYLFTKLISNNKGWELCTPDEWEDENHIYWRNKVTLKVKHDSHNYFVTLLSTNEWYEIHIIHSMSELPFQLQKDGRSICKHVWEAIHTVLEKSPNKPLQAYKVACICTIETHSHIMKFDRKPHENLSKVTADCTAQMSTIVLPDTQPSVMVWFKTPHIQKQGGKMHLCNLLFKIEDDRKDPKCELQLEGKTVSEVDCKPEGEMFKLSIESELKGVYECVVSTAEQPMVSTSVEVIINVDKTNMKCPVCLNIYVDPCTLSCGHTFCQLCLARMWKNNEKSCPMCKEIWKVLPAISFDYRRNIESACGREVERLRKEYSYEDRELIEKFLEAKRISNLPSEGLAQELEEKPQLRGMWKLPGVEVCGETSVVVHSSQGGTVETGISAALANLDSSKASDSNGASQGSKKASKSDSAVKFDPLDQVINNVHIGQIAEEVREWEGCLCDGLDLSPADVETIKTKHEGKLKLQTREALLMWKERKGHQATYYNLIRIFEGARNQLCADFIRHNLLSSQRLRGALCSN